MSVISVGSVAELATLEDKIRDGMVSRNVQISVSGNLCDSVLKSSPFEEGVDGVLDWAVYSKDGDNYIMELKFQRHAGYFARYDTPLDRWDEEHEIGDMESYENGLAGDY